MITHPQAGAVVRIPLLIAVMASACSLFQVAQATAINRIGNGVVGDVQVRLFGKLVRSTWPAPARLAWFAYVPVGGSMTPP